MTNPPTQMYPFDTRPLTDPVDPRAVSEFWRSIRSRYPTSASTIVAWVIIGVVGWRAARQGVPREASTVVGIVLAVIFALVWLWLFLALVAKVF